MVPGKVSTAYPPGLKKRLDPKVQRSSIAMA